MLLNHAFLMRQILGHRYCLFCGHYAKPEEKHMCLFPSWYQMSDIEDTFAQSKWFWLEVFIDMQRLYNTGLVSVSFL